MKLCDVVKNSIWYDPRVKKQIYAYVANGVELECVGVTDSRYIEEEVNKLSCKVELVAVSSDMYFGKRSILKKIKRELLTNKGIYKAILKTDADVIHANDLNALIPAYKAAKKMKCKLVYDSHEIFLENPWIAKNKIIKWFWSFYEKRIISKVDLVVCVSNAAADYFVEKYNIPKPLVVTNCISVEKHISGKCEKHEPKQILNHGQFYIGRGYDIMIETAPLLRDMSDIQLVLRGFGPMEEQLKKRAEEIHADNVYFAPPVKVEELIPEASHAWVGMAITEAISLNFKLSVSNKIFEYAAAGLPVIMSDIPEHRYLNDRYNFGIILEKNTPECILAAIKKLYEDEKLYNVYSENSRKLSRDINWENEFEVLIALERNWSEL
ncbi:MAG: hypothetical protein DBX97_03060 [Collinsella tanakaei]|nr:MAG: hypothetical protein DBX97_03060 [Collinsella tanakaei]